MLRNIEFTVLKAKEIDKVENFNLEFSSISYYYFLKLRKTQIASCPYIKIRITNEKSEAPIIYQATEGILFIVSSFDFTHYLELSHLKKLKFQYEMMYSILKEAFIHYEVNWRILDEINNELADNNWQMKYKFLKKKIEKAKEFNLIIYMDIDAFTFVGDIIENGKKREIEIFKSIPTYFAVDYLFKRYRFFDNKVRIGSKEKAVFELDLDTRIVKVVDTDNKMLNKLRFK